MLSFPYAIATCQYPEAKSRVVKYVESLKLNQSVEEGKRHGA